MHCVMTTMVISLFLETIQDLGFNRRMRFHTAPAHSPLEELVHISISLYQGYQDFQGY